jgi:hypothetical protein
VLKDAGLSAHEAWEIWQQGFNGVDAGKRPADVGDDPDAAFTQYVREKVHLLKRRKEQGKVKNTTGFLLKAIRQNYGNPEFAEERKSGESWKKLQANLVRKKVLEDKRRLLGGCPRIMTADCEGLGQVDRFCSQSATDCVEAARDRLSEGPDLSKTPFHPSHLPSLSA